jgi:hypothetical protein
LIDRRSYIGGTASIIILGHDPYSNWADLYDYMTGVRDEDFDPSNYHIQRGNAMEPMVIEMLRESHHLPINTPAHFEEFDNNGADPNQIFLLDQREFGLVGGHMDCMSDSTDFEIKCPAMRNLSMYASNGTPRKYYVQLQNYMRMTGHEFGEIVLFNYDKWSLIRIKIAADPKMHRQMEERYDEFLMHVAKGIRPTAMAKRLEWHTEVDSPLLDEALREYDEHKTRRYSSEEAQKEWKHRILDHLGDQTNVVTENWSIVVEDRERVTYDKISGDRKSSKYKVLNVKERQPLAT